MSVDSFTRESIERALNIHKHAHRIVDWHRDPIPEISRRGGYTILLNSGFWLDLRTLRETWILVNGLASAQHAQEMKEQDWADQLAAANAETKDNS